MSLSGDGTVRFTHIYAQPNATRLLWLGTRTTEETQGVGPAAGSIMSSLSMEKCLYGYHQRENTGSRLFTAVKPCWTGLISRWVIKYPVLYSTGSQAGVMDINHSFHLYHKNVVCGLSFSRSQPDFEVFLRALRFPPSSKLTPSLFQFDRMQDLPGNHFRVSGASWVNIIHYYSLLVLR